MTVGGLKPWCKTAHTSQARQARSRGLTPSRHPRASMQPLLSAVYPGKHAQGSQTQACPPGCPCQREPTLQPGKRREMLSPPPTAYTGWTTVPTLETSH